MSPEARTALEICAAVLNLVLTSDDRVGDIEEAINQAESALGYEVGGRPESVVRREFA